MSATSPGFRSTSAVSVDGGASGAGAKMYAGSDGKNYNYGLGGGFQTPPFTSLPASKEGGGGGE